jgi:glycosyltransferase involved in cell wall biosynthesis
VKKSILIISKFAPPYEFSEGIVTGKLALILIEEGWDVHIVSGSDPGPSYNNDWSTLWAALKPITDIVTYKKNNLFIRIYDLIRSTIKMKYPIDGVRWAHRAFKISKKLVKDNKYDLILTRSPQDISHLVGLKLKNKFPICWIANWDDPAVTIWPYPYTAKLTNYKFWIFNRFSKEVLLKADILTFPSQRLKSLFFKEFSLSRNSYYIIPHAMLSCSNIKYLIQKQERSERSDTIKICHSGNLSKERNPFTFLEAIQEIVKKYQYKFRFDIIGTCDTETHEMLNKLDIASYFTFLGPKPYETTLTLLANYDLLIILEADMEDGIYLPSKLSDYLIFNKPIWCLSPPIGTLHDYSLLSERLVHTTNTNPSQIIEDFIHICQNLIGEGQNHKNSSLGKLNFLSNEYIIAKYNYMHNLQNHKLLAS